MSLLGISIYPISVCIPPITTSHYVTAFMQGESMSEPFILADLSVLSLDILCTSEAVILMRDLNAGVGALDPTNKF